MENDATSENVVETLIEVEAKEGILHTRLEALLPVIEWLAAIIEVFAIIVLLIGVSRYLSCFVRAEVASTHDTRLSRLYHGRLDLGRYVLAGLELFIVADLLHSATTLKVEDLIFLGLLVLIRTVISFFLDREIRELKNDDHL